MARSPKFNTHSGNGTGYERPLTAGLEVSAHKEADASKLAEPSLAVMTNLLRDMRSSWSQGNRPLAEEFIRCLPVAVCDENAAVDLIYAEFLLKQEYGETVSTSEYLERFPQYAAALQRQFSLDALLGATDSDIRGQTVVAAPSDSHPLLRGKDFPTSLGKYLLVAPLDRGGQAEVFLALHPVLRKEVVLKLSRQPLATDSAVAARLLDEGRIVAKLEHPHLARVYDLDLHQGYPFLVVEHVRGKSLDQYVRQTNVSPADAIRIVTKVAQAVAAAHRHNVVHLDIKPKNIIVDEQGTPWLIDFGLARWNDAWSSATASGQICGTLQFMAPEQARGDEEQIGEATDVFGLGGLLYFLLTKRTPFEGTNVSELLQQISAGEWNQAPLNDSATPATLRRICQKAMAADPAQRYSSANELVAALPSSEHASVRRWSLLAAALCACLLVALAAWRFAGSNKPAPITNTPPAIALRVWGAEQFVPVAERLPLQQRDELQIQCTIPADSSAALVLFDSEGQWHELRRWQSSHKDRDIRYPDENQTVPLTGQPGTELLLLLVKRTTPLDTTRLLESLDFNTQLSSLPPYTLIHLDNSGIRAENLGRAFGPPIEREDPQEQVIARLTRMRSTLEDAAVDFTGIAFAHE